MKKVGVFVITAILLFGFAGQKASAQFVKLKYKYDGKFGSLRIADSALAYFNGNLIAKAWALKIIKQSNGPNHILVNEIQYDFSGNAVYEGTIEIEFGPNGGVVKETVISGVKKYNYVFRSWPCGNR